jgi:two-component system nitrate/nitrite response regulator NarL
MEMIIEKTTIEERSTATEPLGVVWIKNSPSLLSIGLETALKKSGSRVHRGPEPPTPEPSVVVYSVENDNDHVVPDMGRLKELAPDATIVAFGPSANVSLARTALQAGADGFLHAGMSPENVVRGLEKAHEGERVLPRELLRGLVAKNRDPDLRRLSPRQIEILRMVAEGQSNAQIAKLLYLSESTIKQHLRGAYKILGVKNRNQAARHLRRGNLNNGVQ